jgi:hypothetical protein
MKYLLSLTLVVSFARAATISTSATCDGVTTVGTTSASCNDGRFKADARVSQSSLVVDALFLPAFPPGGGGEALANFSDDYVFTVTGGTGEGVFHPCVSGDQDRTDAGAGVSLGGIGVGVINPPCADTSFAFSDSGPFTFGVPQIVHYTIEGFANPSLLHGSADATATFDGIVFFDPSGNLLANVSFTLVEVPEPAAWTFLSIGVLFSVAIRRIVAKKLSIIPR